MKSGAGRYWIAALVVMSLPGCYTQEVDTLEDWCQQLAGVDILRNNRPFWAVGVGISFDGDGIRDDFVSFLDSSMLEKVGSRADRMAWRDSTVLHLESLSNLMVVEPDSIIDGWRRGIQRAANYEPMDEADQCLWGSVVSLFDEVHIHVAEMDEENGEWLPDEVTVIDTKRRVLLDNPI